VAAGDEGEAGQGLRSAPEMYRTRAQGAASHATTAAGAIAAGVIFGAQDKLGELQRYAAAGAVLLLLTSIVAYVVASQHSRDDEVNKEDFSKSVKHLASTIRKWTRWGAYLSLAGAALIVIMVIDMAVSPEEKRVDIRVALSVDGLQNMRSVCPNLTSNFPAEIDESALSSSAPLIKVVVRGSLCDKAAGSTTIYIARQSVLAARGIHK
jgi:multisubunit Na+/H+ antiporter MnhG subunit